MENIRDNVYITVINAKHEEEVKLWLRKESEERKRKSNDVQTRFKNHANIAHQITQNWEKKCGSEAFLRVRKGDGVIIKAEALVLLLWSKKSVKRAKNPLKRETLIFMTFSKIRSGFDEEVKL